MKKLIAAIIFLSAFSLAKAQTSICGVDFGTTYSKAEQILENKFGYRDIELSDKLNITFQDKQYAGYIWNMMQFIFQGDGNNRYFHYCILCRHFKTSKEAANFRDELVRKLQPKYGNITEAGVIEGFKSYYGGTDPFDSRKYGFLISALRFDNGLYGAGIWYGPYDIVHEEL